MTEYDPDKRPVPSEEELACARENGLHLVQIMCDEPEAKVGDHTGMTCIALASFIPRPGDKIDLEDKTTCVVRSVRHNVVTKRNSDGSAKCVVLYPIVVAVRETQ